MTEKPTILHVLATVNRGGAELRTLEAIRGLPKNAPSQMVLTLTGQGGTLEPAFTAAGVEVRYSHIKRPWRLYRSLKRIAVSHHVVAVHSHVNEFSGVVLVLARLCGVPVRIAHFRSDGAGRRLSRRSRVLNSIFRFMIDKSATNIVGVSPGALYHAWHHDWQDDPRCQVLLSGLDLRRFEASNDPFQTRKQFGLDPLKPLVLHVGRGMAVKNRDRALKVFAEVTKNEPDAQLAFVGRDTPPDRQRWAATALDLKIASNVHFIDEVDDVAPLMLAADALILTSTHEGLPGVIVEAVAAGLPVVASKLPGTEYLAARLPNIALHALDEPDSAWANSIITQLAISPTSSTRAAATQSLVGTEFDLQDAIIHYQQLWQAHPLSRD